jgi:hypothetical protein
LGNRTELLRTGTSVDVEKMRSVSDGKTRIGQAGRVKQRYAQDVIVMLEYI